ncbi:hypothetical protein BJF78_01885 [Pseudonocardia sp. CNS-139]|nr:hypothetical protein BJF78_01885 [Pseudonocardia sp. CNS-139]
MKAPARPHTRRTRTSSTTVTVAELLARQAGLPVPPPPVPVEPSRAISVAALLRREGCGPHSLDRPLLPRGHSRPEPVRKRRRVRKATTTAGVFLAASAVIGSALVDHAVRERAVPEASSDVVVPNEAPGSGALRSAEAAGPAGGPVDGYTLATVALFLAEAVPLSTTGALENTGPFAEPPPVERVTLGVRPQVRTGGFLLGEPAEPAPRSGGQAAPVSASPPFAQPAAPEPAPVFAFAGPRGPSPARPRRRTAAARPPRRRRWRCRRSRRPRSACRHLGRTSRSSARCARPR